MAHEVIVICEMAHEVIAFLILSFPPKCKLRFFLIDYDYIILIKIDCVYLIIFVFSIYTWMDGDIFFRVETLYWL